MSHQWEKLSLIIYLITSYFFFYAYLKYIERASLVAQWLRVCLPMQGTWVRSLVWEDSTCHGASKPMSHKY